MEFEIYGWGPSLNALEDWIDDWMVNHDLPYWADVGEVSRIDTEVFLWTWDDMREQGAWVMEDLMDDYRTVSVQQTQ